jgi:protein-L-isoaspartate O-methyltransferase
MPFSRRFYRWLRKRGFPWADWQAALVEIIGDSPRRKDLVWELTFERKEDPFEFSEPHCVARHAHVCEILSAVRGSRKFRRALEVGCAEGMFSQRLAEQCDSVLATDVSAVALRRARARCADLGHIEFAPWNLRRGLMIEKFDLIIAMDVLYYLSRPWDLRRAAQVLIEALNPEGYLLIENDKEHYLYEERWWAKYIFHNARAIDSLFVRSPYLELVSSEDNGKYICTLLRKTEARAGGRSVVSIEV